MKKYLKKHKWHLTAFVILILVAGGSGIYLKISDYQFNTCQHTPSACDGIHPSLEGKPITNLKSKTLPTGGQVNNLQYSTSSLDNNKTTLPTGQTGYNPTTNTSNNLSPTIPHPEPEFIKLVTLMVNDEEYKMELRENLTVYELMQNLSASSIKPFIFETKDYGGMGMFVESINDVKNDPQNNKYWIYYINGESAKMGISNYILKPNDLIEWKYEVSKM